MNERVEHILESVLRRYTHVIGPLVCGRHAHVACIPISDQRIENVTLQSDQLQLLIWITEGSFVDVGWLIKLRASRLIAFWRQMWRQKTMTHMASGCPNTDSTSVLNPTTDCSNTNFKHEISWMSVESRQPPWSFVICVCDQWPML